MPDGLDAALWKFYKDEKFSGKGKLSVALVVTEHAKKTGLPLGPERLLTHQGGQVLGMGKAAVQNILARHDVTRVLAQEGGRTSRGSISSMRAYVGLVNRLQQQGLISNPDDIKAIERFWGYRVEDFFAGKPFKVRPDPSKGVRAIIREVVAQAEARRSEGSGMMVTGAVLHHLVGAKLELALENSPHAKALLHHSFSTSDQQTSRAGDFVVGDTALHVTVIPSEAVLQRCFDNLGAGLRPIIVTTKRGVAAAEVLAENLGIEERLDVFEVEQFIALNLYELSGFDATERKTTIAQLIARYNDVVEQHETDPSLKIDLG